jgi:hypothetical protein
VADDQSRGKHNVAEEQRLRMEIKVKRSGEAVEIKIPIEVSGADCMGAHFLAQTHTLAVSRQGGKICLEHMLVPQQDVAIRCLDTGLEAEARVVGQIGKNGGIHHYAVKFHEKKVRIWGVEFPPRTEPEGTVGRVLLQCAGCKNLEVICLDEFELEVLEVDGHISHSCKRCRDASLWRMSQSDLPAAAATVSIPIPAEVQERRREPRRPMSVTACVRTTRFGDDLVKTRTVSRTGLSFASSWNYVPGDVVEVAVPYSPGGGNLFMTAKVARVQYLEAESTRVYGIAYQNARK